jgi:hypothetical protein
MSKPRHDLVGRALLYPYNVPSYGYLFDAGYVTPIEGADFAGRVPVLAYGSNAAPEQLIRKFGTEKGVRIPVSRASATGIDVVFAALFSGYGAVPATIHDSPGTEIFIHATWLTAEQLEVMHVTEGRGEVYLYGRFPRDRVSIRDAPEPEEVFVYVAGAGALGPEPAALENVPAANRTFPEAGQRDVQREVRGRLAPDVGLYDFVLTNVRNDALRAERSAALAADARPWSVTGFTPLS